MENLLSFFYFMHLIESLTSGPTTQTVDYNDTLKLSILWFKPYFIFCKWGYCSTPSDPVPPCAAHAYADSITH